MMKACLERGWRSRAQLPDRAEGRR